MLGLRSSRRHLTERRSFGSSFLGTSPRVCSSADHFVFFSNGRFKSPNSCNPCWPNSCAIHSFVGVSDWWLVFACSPHPPPRTQVSHTILTQADWCAVRAVAPHELGLLPVIKTVESAT